MLFQVSDKHNAPLGVMACPLIAEEEQELPPPSWFAPRDRSAQRIQFGARIAPGLLVERYSDEKEFMRSTRDSNGAPRQQPLKSPALLFDTRASSDGHAEAVQQALRDHYHLTHTHPEGLLLVWYSDEVKVIDLSPRGKQRWFLDETLKRRIVCQGIVMCMSVTYLSLSCRTLHGREKTNGTRGYVATIV